MSYILIRHGVQDYQRWRRVFDEHGALRKAAGSKGSHVFRTAGNPNQIVTLLEWDDLEKGRKFAGSNELREAMEKAGVIGQPEVVFLDDAGRTTQ